MDLLPSLLNALGIAVFVLVLILGAGLTLLGMPGTLLIVVDAAIYSALRGWKLPLWLLGVLLAMSLVAEIADNLISAAGTKKYGGSTKGMLWAMSGGLAGAFAVGAMMAPLGLAGLVLGPILGGLAGGYLGAYWYERRQGRPEDEARRAGMGAIFGRVAGTMLKTIIASAMVVIVLINAF